MDIFNALPPILRGLEPELLMLLVQDTSHLMAILNRDGSVNIEKLNALRTSLSRPVINTVPIPRDLHNVPMWNRTVTNTSFDVRPTEAFQPHHIRESYYPQVVMDSNRGATHPKKLSKAASKAAIPCRFFNTAKGCQFGDKCAFGHFLDENPTLNTTRFPLGHVVGR
jgi:hypothetical protein